MTIVFLSVGNECLIDAFSQCINTSGSVEILLFIGGGYKAQFYQAAGHRGFA